MQKENEKTILEMTTKEDRRKMAVSSKNGIEVPHLALISEQFQTPGWDQAKMDRVERLTGALLGLELDHGESFSDRLMML